MKNENLPLYIKTKNAIKSKIDSGEYKAGEPIPTEKNLCDIFTVSRVTIRKAISELIDEGVLIHSKGKSPIVRPDSLYRNTNRLTGLYEELAANGILCSSFILSCEVETAGDDLAGKMSINTGDKVLKLARVRYGNGKPLCYQKIYLNYKYCEGIEKENLRSSSLYGVLEDKYGIRLTKANQVISACLSSYKIAALLETEETPLLKIERTAFLADNTCMEYSLAYYLSEKYCLYMTLER